MPLFVEGKLFETEFVSASGFLETFPSLKGSAEFIQEQPVQQFDSLPPKTLYVYQREFAVTHPDDTMVDVLGSDDATTCHILVLHHTGSGITALGHFDGSCTHEGITDVLQIMKEMMAEKSTDGRIEVHIFGGFNDTKETSKALSAEVIASFQTNTEEVHLKTLCCCELNNVSKANKNWPIIYGVGVNVKTGEIFQAEFKEKGPDAILRSARIFGGFDQMLNVYNSVTGEFRICPFEYEVSSSLSFLLTLPDHIFLQNTSTSPDVEKPSYVQQTKATFQFMLDNPRPADTLFIGGKARVYTQCGGKWTLRTGIV